MRHHHLSDLDLVLALDGELSVRRQAVVDAHLIECTSCRTRRSQLREGAELATAIYRSTLLNAEGITASREALRSKLVDLGRQQGTFIDRLTSSFAGMSRWAVVGAAAVVVILLARVMPQSDVRPDRGAPIENGALPIASLTPGATWNLSVDELCAPARHEKRQVSNSIRVNVVSAYGMERVPADEYELDYLITPELGGAPTAQNLWPQRYASRTWNAHVKDQLEQLLPTMVCDGAISLQTAQQDIAVDWIAAYKKYFHTDTPLRLHAELDDRFMRSQDDDLLYPIWRSGHSPSLTLVSFSAGR
jgi:anti-sigma factor RsiW